MFGTGANEYDVDDIPEPPKTAGPDTSNFPDDHHDRLIPGATLVRKFGSMLLGRDDVRKSPSGTLKRLGKPSTSPRPSGDMISGTSISGGDEEKTSFPDESVNEKGEETVVALSAPTPPSKPITHSVSQPPANVHRRAATILDPQGRAARHERRSSTGAPLTAPISTFGRRRRPSTGYNSTSSRPFAERLFSRHEPSDLAEKREEEEVGDKPHSITVNSQDGGGGGGETFREEDERHTNEKDFKPVFLKGLFSVATTSTKAPSVIKADIRRVLDRMQVQYRDMKGGFECIHLPSIDLTSVETSNKEGHFQASSTFGDTISRSRPSIIKKASKLSFTLRRDKGKEKDHFVDNKDKDRDVGGRPSGATNLTTPSSDSSSFINVASNHTVVPSQDQEVTPTQVNGPSAFSSPVDAEFTSPISATPATPVTPVTPVTPASNKTKVLPPIPREFAPRTTSPLPAQSPSPMPTGEVDRHVFESMGNNSLSVRFEINIVKVPWLPLHGIQFRRASGDGWQYQMLARRVLTELKL
jgi:hypothetical protein